MMYVLQNVHWFILLVGALVFFHELGHFLVAKWCGIRVIRFSIGFGPKLFSFVRGHTEYRIGALPLGGYVKMLGDIPGAEVPHEERHEAFGGKPVWQRAAVVAAGPAFNFILAFVVYALIFAGVRTFPDTKIGAVSYGDPAWNAGLRPGDRIVAVNGTEIERWDELRTLIGSKPDEDVSVVYDRAGVRHQVIMSPAAHSELDEFRQTTSRGRIGVSFLYIKPVIAIVDEQSPAATLGLQTDDVVTAVNGTKVEAWHELRRAMAATPADQPVALTVLRGEETLQFNLRWGAYLRESQPIRTPRQILRGDTRAS